MPIVLTRLWHELHELYRLLGLLKCLSFRLFVISNIFILNIPLIPEGKNIGQELAIFASMN